MATQITATLPTLDFPKEVDYPTQEDWAAFSAAAELNFGILGGSWSTQMQLWKTQANAMSTELNTNSTIAQGLANYQGDWTSKGYTLGQTVSVSEVYYICKLTHASGQNPTANGSIYWNLAIGNWNLKVNNYGNETIAGIKTFSSSPIVPTPITGTQAVNKDYADLKVALASFTGTNQSLLQNGYQKLPGGLIIQWGKSEMTSDDTAIITFPIAFPNGVLNYSASLGSSLDGIYSYSIGIGPTAIPKTTASVTITSTGPTLLTGFSWLVFGY